MKTIQKIITPSQKVHDLQQRFSSEISLLLPHAKVELIGSMAVPMSGREEIDIMVLSENVLEDSRVLVEHGYRQGPVVHSISYLKKDDEGFEIGVQIIPSGHKMVEIHRAILAKLRSDESLRRRYEDFKKSLMGVSLEE